MSGPQHHYNCTLLPIAINSCTPLIYMHNKALAFAKVTNVGYVAYQLNIHLLHK